MFMTTHEIMFIRTGTRMIITMAATIIIRTTVGTVIAMTMATDTVLLISSNQFCKRTMCWRLATGRG